MNWTNTEKKIQLMELCQRFIDENDIYCPETVAQTDHVIVNAYDFITEICEIVGYKESCEDEE